MLVKDHMRLRLAGTPYRYPAQRETDALEQLGENATTFWLRVDRLLDDPEAVAAYPQIVGRLRRLREARVAARRRCVRGTQSPAELGTSRTY